MTNWLEIMWKLTDKYPLNIAFAKDENISQRSLSNETGKVLMTGKIESADFLIDLSRYSSGTYLFKTTLNNYSNVHKIIKL